MITSDTSSLSSALEKIAACALTTSQACACIIVQMPDALSMASVDRLLPGESGTMLLDLSKQLSASLTAKDNPTFIEDFRQSTFYHSHTSYTSCRYLVKRGLHSAMITPITYKGRFYGYIMMYYRQNSSWHGEELKLSEGFCCQIALSIEYHRFRVYVAEGCAGPQGGCRTCASAESVTQLFFAATLIAKSLPLLWQKGDGKYIEWLFQLDKTADETLQIIDTQMSIVNRAESRSCKKGIAKGAHV